MNSLLPSSVRLLADFLPCVRILHRSPRSKVFIPLDAVTHTHSSQTQQGEDQKEAKVKEDKNRTAGFNPWVGKTPWRREWHPTPVLVPGESHGGRSLVGYSPWGRKESDTTEQLHFHFSLSCIGEGNGNPLQCSCLENPKDGGAWWATVYGVAQSWTRLKSLSSSSSSM